jgi:hypothetical protein
MSHHDQLNLGMILFFISLSDETVECHLSFIITEYLNEINIKPNRQAKAKIAQ